MIRVYNVWNSHTRFVKAEEIKANTIEDAIRVYSIRYNLDVKCIKAKLYYERSMRKIK